MVIQRWSKGRHSDYLDGRTYPSIFLLNHLNWPLPALSQRSEVLLHKWIQKLFCQILWSLHYVLLGFLWLCHVSWILWVNWRDYQSSLYWNFRQLFTDPSRIDNVVLNCLVELRKIQRNEKIQQNINSFHHSAQFTHMDESHMFIDPLFALGSEIRVVLKLLYFCLIRLQFNNVQLTLKRKIVYQLVYEYFAQHRIKPNQTNCLVVKSVPNHETGFYYDLKNLYYVFIFFRI